MTDYSDLVKRLRGNPVRWSDSKEAADAIEALYTRLAELEARFDYIETTVEKRVRSSETSEILSIIRKERVFYDCV